MRTLRPWERVLSVFLVFVPWACDSEGPDPDAGGGGAPGQGDLPDRIEGSELYDCKEPEGSLPPLRLEWLSDGLDSPVGTAHAPGDADRLFVLEKRGTVRIFSEGSLREKPFLDIQERVLSSGGEQGLLGLAFSPSFAKDGLIYVHYSNSDGATRLSEFQAPSGDEQVDPESERVVLEISQPAANHNGGSIAFGLDRRLYLFLGDGGGSYDSYENAQALSSLLGKTLRLDPRPGDQGEYGVPPGNLHETVDGAEPLIWAYGLRNPFRTSFDACTGDLYLGDVGQDRQEEINYEPALSGGRNYGWPIWEGTRCWKEEQCDSGEFTPPIATFGNLDGSAVIGGAVYRGARIPALRGSYFYADFGYDKVFRLRVLEGEASEPELLRDELAPPFGISSIQNGGDGELYFTVYGDPNTEGSGSLHRLSAAE